MNEKGTYWEKLARLKSILGGGRAFLVSILEAGESHYNTTKLDRELSAIAPAAADEPPPPPPSLLAEKEAAWKLLYRRAAILHTKLLLVDIETRKGYAFQILTIEKQLEAYWAEIDHFKREGYWPQKAFILEGEGENMKRINNLRSYISKGKKDPTKAAKVKAWEDELEAMIKIAE